MWRRLSDCGECPTLAPDARGCRCLRTSVYYISFCARHIMRRNAMLCFASHSSSGGTFSQSKLQLLVTPLVSHARHIGWRPSHRVFRSRHGPQAYIHLISASAASPSTGEASLPVILAAVWCFWASRAAIRRRRGTRVGLPASSDPGPGPP